ncbi:MAG: GMC family oxidoreductase N-terminal domain-containing protein, partial [Leptospiraceae bacterium]|nr:GMC family oxidoreductase N-terminal domain-containing protein [Leptospiraceae bacterium]
KTFKSDNVFVCCGPTESPALLQRSGIRRNIGNNLRIHPYLKLLSKYPEPIYSDSSPTPLLQVKEFWPEITIGGSYFTPGHMAVNLSDNWNGLQQLMDERQFMASFYVGVRGTNRGTVRNSSIDHKTIIKYDLSEQDLRNLSIGLARSACILLAGGAKAVYPSIAGFEQIKDPTDAIVWLEKILPANQLSLTTVHAFSTCPMGEKRDRCAVDSFGRVYGFQNLFVNDASILPDSPGVNPQGTVMAFARRNALRFLEEMRNQV